MSVSSLCNLACTDVQTKAAVWYLHKASMLCFLTILTYHCKKYHELSDSGFHCIVHHSSMLASDNLILQDATSVCAVCVFPCWQHAIVPEDGCWHSRQHSFWPLANECCIVSYCRTVAMSRTGKSWIHVSQNHMRLDFGSWYPTLHSVCNGSTHSAEIFQSYTTFVNL